MPVTRTETAAAMLTEVVLPGVVEPSGLQLRTRPLPVPGRGEALVAVLASGVSFAEQSMRRGRYPGQPRFPFVPGYDLVGTVVSVGPGDDARWVGRRVAAMTKTGGWASHALVTTEDLVPVPDGVEAAAVETLVVNGLTAWRMLHRTAKVRPGQTVLVHGASGGVGTTLVQLAVRHGVRVIGTAAPRHHDALRALGAEPVDYATAGLTERLHQLAPDGVDAVFDHLGGESLRRSWDLLALGGRLVSYAIAADLDAPGSLVATFAATLARLLGWDLLPNGRRAGFYNVWAGHLIRPRRFRARMRADLATVFGLLAEGALTAQVGATLPLARVVEAMQLAESHTVRGKVVLVP
ncbi:medium chain dehydrogenase/reductase family protein [uncultured Friedmanniella sp.]|uniref:medium chain dehydrogenase/reductase family protein n=1 Tax=uncultured Friedmanniella sp. TaxID=335381 RepID=UPI0035C9CEF8